MIVDCYSKRIVILINEKLTVRLTARCPHRLWLVDGYYSTQRYNILAITITINI